MPIRADHYDSMSGLLPIFDMNLPEGALRERLRLQFAKAIPEFDDLDLLGIVGSSQIGRWRYSPQDELDVAVPKQDLNEILTYQGAADLFAHLLERFATYSGVSGIQPKVLVRDAKAPDKLTHRGATHIVKTFDPAEYPELAANEFICTSGAAAAGIRTASVQLSVRRRDSSSDSLRSCAQALSAWTRSVRRELQALPLCAPPYQRKPRPSVGCGLCSMSFSPAIAPI